MDVIKRDGSKVEFVADKIRNAIQAANKDVDEKVRISKVALDGIVSEVILDCEHWCREHESEEISVEEISDIAEEVVMDEGYFDVARSYIRYRFKRELLRKSNTTDKAISELLDGTSEFWNSENSNKNAKWVTTQRDYIAGITSKDIARRFIFDKDVIEAHDRGVIHIHDMDYAAQNTLTNCELINLEDMLQNGTSINNVTIDKPHRFITATTIASQIIAAVASSTYGGATITLTHLAPFVRSSHERYLRKYLDWGFSQEKAEEYASIDTKKEVADGVQTLNYQLNSLSTTNGQSPFITIFMYLNETNEYKDELAMIIEEVLNQRIQGMKNKVGVYVTPAFPKLIYVLEEDNINEDSKYWYLTLLAAKCSAKRLVPDYISEKVMKQTKVDSHGVGHCFPSMGKRNTTAHVKFLEPCQRVSLCG